MHSSSCLLQFLIALSFRLVDAQLQLTDVKSQVLALEENNDELSKANSSLEAENSHLINDLNKLKQNLSYKDDELCEAQDEIRRLLQMEHSQNSLIKDMKEKVATYVATEQKQKSEFDDTCKELKELHCINKQMKVDVEKLEQENTEIQSALQSQEDVAESYRRELIAVKAELESTKHKLSLSEQGEKEIAVLAKKAKEETKKVMEDMSAKLESSCNDIRYELEHTHKIELDIMSSDMKRVTEENCRLLVKFERCTDDLTTEKKRNNDMNTKLQRSCADLAEEQKQHAMIQAQLREVSFVVNLWSWISYNSRLLPLSSVHQ